MLLLSSVRVRDNVDCGLGHAIEPAEHVEICYHSYGTGRPAEAHPRSVGPTRRRRFHTIGQSLMRTFGTGPMERGTRVLRLNLHGFYSSWQAICSVASELHSRSEGGA